VSEPFIPEEVYFRVVYPDPTRKYPRIESFVYVGKNLSDEDAEDTWYFQFADSFVKDGSILKSAGGDRRVSCVSKSELDDMLSDEQLLNELSAARSRRLADLPP
jgi:hypothetical protein